MQTVKIAGEEVVLEWTQESQRRFVFRMGEIGGEPTKSQLTNPKTAQVAIFKIIWGLLPKASFSKYPTPEDLFVAVDHENEGKELYLAINAIYEESSASAEKKSSSRKSPSHKSN